MHKKRNDIILISCIALFILIGFIFLIFHMQKKEPMFVKIYHENELVETIELKKDYKCVINEVEIVIDNDKVYVKNSSCKDHVCMNQGKIYLPGQTITCLPQKVVIRIEGKGVDVGI